MAHLVILMATYNGSSFIEAQLESLRGQTFSGWQLLVRDDGSRDDTIEKIRSFASQDERIRMLENDKTCLGASLNYSRMLEQASVQADYLMFCDQDDVWRPDKIKVTLTKMREMEERFSSSIPLLVHSDLSVANRGLHIIASSFWDYQRLNPAAKGLNRLLVQNNVTGCTVMINRALATLASPVPPQAVMHDWWLALVAAAFGKIGHIPRSTMLYRQHGANDTGAKYYGFAYAVRKALAGLGEMKASLLKTQCQACAFLARYASRLEPEQRLLLEAYCNLYRKGFWARRWQLLRFGFYKHGFFRNIGMFLSL